MRYLLLLFLLSQCSIFFAQQSASDILKEAEVLRNAEKIEEAYTKFEEIANLASENKDITIQSKALLKMALLKMQEGDYVSGKKLISKLDSLTASQNFDIRVFHNYANAAYSYYIGFEEDALKIAHESIQEIELTGKGQDRLSSLHYLLYIIYSDGQYDIAEKHARKAEGASLITKDYNDLFNAYSALGNIFDYKFQDEGLGNYQDSVYYYHTQAANVYKKNPKEVIIYNYGNANLNLAAYFFKKRKEIGTQAIDSIKHYLSIVQEIDNRLVSQKSRTKYIQTASIMGILGSIDLEDNNNVGAEQKFLQAYSLLSENENVSTYYTLEKLCTSLTDVYTRMRQLEKALYFQQKISYYKDKQFNERLAQNAQLLEARFQNERILHELELSEQKASKHLLQTLLLGAVALFTIITSILVYRYQKQKNRLLSEKQKRLQQEKEELERNSEMELLLEKEEQARLLAEQELLKLKNEKMQKEALANVLLHEQKDELLKNIHIEIKKGSITEKKKAMDIMIKSKMKNFDNLNRSVDEFKEIHPIFFKSLDNISGNKLTPLDCKYCAYIYLGLDNQEIANLLFVEARSIRVRKYRIKQKLGLDKDTNLQAFLQSLNP